MKVITDPSTKEYSDLVFEGLDELEIDEEETGLSDKPWTQTKKSNKRRRGHRFSDDDWEEQNKARQKYLKEWEEDLRYAKELADEGM
jgi:hypothetical protein